MRQRQNLIWGLLDQEGQMVIDEAIVELYFMKLFSLSNAAH